MTVLLRSLEPLFGALRGEGFRVVGPTVADDVIVLDELDSAADLPYGWATELGPGRYRLRRRPDGAAFGHLGMPDSWKAWLAPAGPGAVLPDPDARHALFGVRPCDLRAIAVLDRMAGDGRHPDAGYAARRRAAFIVAVNCTEPGPTCFCASAGGGPSAEGGFDLALTELPGPRYVVEPGSPAGKLLLDTIAAPPAGAAERETAQAGVARAGDLMGLELPAVDLPAVLAATRDDPRWARVGDRCLTCGNCTMVCPSCFWTTVIGDTDAAGGDARRTTVRDSCSGPEFPGLRGGPAGGWYRHWLNHKFGAWHDRFGESGCVGCGRCIVWCPVGIDMTEELRALAEAGRAGGEGE